MEKDNRGRSRKKLKNSKNVSKKISKETRVKILNSFLEQIKKKKEEEMSLTVSQTINTDRALLKSQREE